MLIFKDLLHQFSLSEIVKKVKVKNSLYCKYLHIFGQKMSLSKSCLSYTDFVGIRVAEMFICVYSFVFCRFAGKTVSSGSLVLVSVSLRDSDALITINTEKTVMASMLLRQFKTALTNSATQKLTARRARGLTPIQSSSTSFLFQTLRVQTLINALIQMQRAPFGL